MPSEAKSIPSATEQGQPQPESSSPHPYVFSEAQKNMKQLMENMENRLKKRFLENIDEEIPEEYIKKKE